VGGDNHFGRGGCGRSRSRGYASGRGDVDGYVEVIGMVNVNVRCSVSWNADV